MKCDKSRLILLKMNIQSLRKKAERILSDKILPAVELPYLPQNSVRQRNPLPVSLNREIDVIRQLGVEIRCGVEVGKDVTIEDLREQGYKGFYAAIGCQRGRKPGISGENAEGAYAAVDFLREAGAKESFALEGDVVVVGGGNVAIDAARISSRCTDAKISMFCLEAREKMPASNEETEEALEEGIELNCGWEKIR